MEDEKKKKKGFEKGNQYNKLENRNLKEELAEKGNVGLKIKDILAKGAEPGAEWMVKVVQSPEYSDELKAKCVMYLFDRLMGKPGITVDGEIDSKITVAMADELEKYSK